MCGASRRRDRRLSARSITLGEWQITCLVRAGAGTWRRSAQRTRNQSLRSAGVGRPGFEAGAATRDVPGKPDLPYSLEGRGLRRWPVLAWAPGAFHVRAVGCVLGREDRADAGAGQARERGARGRPAGPYSASGTSRSKRISAPALETSALRWKRLAPGAVRRAASHTRSGGRLLCQGFG